MNSHLDPQKFIGYGSAYESYKFLMNSHLDPSESDPLTVLDRLLDLSKFVKTSRRF
jgi:hypothetical protein